MREISVVLDACHLGELAKEVEAIAQQLEEGPAGYVVFPSVCTQGKDRAYPVLSSPRIIEFVVDESINIFSNGHELTTDFKNAISYWRSKDFFKSGFYTGMHVSRGAEREERAHRKNEKMGEERTGRKHRGRSREG